MFVYVICGRYTVLQHFKETIHLFNDDLKNNDLKSPNELKALVVGTDFIYALKHPVDAHFGQLNGWPLFYPFDRDLEEGSPLEFLSKHVYGTLEMLVVHKDYQKDPVLIDYFKKGRSGYLRLNYVGVTDDDGCRKIATALDKGAKTEDLPIDKFRSEEDMKLHYLIQPEHYDWDKKYADYFKSLKEEVETKGNANHAQQEEVEQEGTKQNELEQDSDSSAEEKEYIGLTEKELDNIAEEYGPLYTQAVSNILSNYSKMFTAAFQIEQPVGIFSIDEKGEPAVYRISGSRRVESRATIRPIYPYLYSDTISSYGLKVLKSRSAKEIASVIVNGGSSDGIDVANHGDRLYFPNKMLEFAYGLQLAGRNQNGATNYPVHSKATSWKNYEPIVRNSLKSAFSETLKLLALKKAKEGHTVKEILMDSSISTEFKGYIDRLRESFLTCIMISDLIKDDENLGLLKVKMLYPYGDLDSSLNLATRACERVYGKADGKKALSRDVEIDDCYSVHSYEADSDMVSASPLFAYKAAKAIMRGGEELTFDKMILGRDISGNILQNGQVPFNLGNSLVHYDIAESRSGKGVATLAKVAAAIKSKMFIPYGDNKPDMGALLLELCPEAFIFNGSAASYSPKDGTNLQKRFLAPEMEGWRAPNSTPDYIKNLFGADDALSLGDIYYLRGVLFTMSIIYARAIHSETFANSDLFKIDGEPRGIAAFFDEWTVANRGIGNKLREMIGKGVRVSIDSEFYDYESKRKAAERDGKPFTKVFSKPPVENFYANELMKKLRSSVKAINYGKNAGLQNAENRRSNVFIIGQEQPILAEDISGESIFPIGNKNADTFLNPKESVIFNNHPLAPFVATGKQDISIGNNTQGWLGSSGNGYAANFINEKARMFGYVPKFTKSNQNDIFSQNSEWGKRNATFYKPFLILPKADMDKYYVQTALKYSKLVGVSAKSIIAQNAQQDSQGNDIEGAPYELDMYDAGTEIIDSGKRLHDAVGLEGYLEYIGVSKEEAYNTLKASGDLAQKLVERIGYKGTWREFLMDLRPEYMFSIDELADCFVNSTSLAANHTKDGNLMYKYYPEAFTVNVQEGMHENEEVQDKIKLMNYFADSDTEGININEIDKERAEQLSNISYLGEEDGNLEDLTELDKDDGLLDSMSFHDPSSSPKPTFQEKDSLLDLTLADLAKADPITQKRILDRVNQIQEESPIINPNDSEKGYGIPGVIFDKHGRAYKLDTAQVDLTDDSWDDYVVQQAIKNHGNQFSYSALEKIVTDKAMAIAKASGGLSDVRVIGGVLAINDKVVGLNMSEQLLNLLPETTIWNVQNGELASYFNWRKLRTGRVRNLNIESKSFVLTTLAEGMGYRKNFDLKNFFEDIPSLISFTIDGEEYTRTTIKYLDEEDIFYGARGAEYAYRVSQAWFTKHRKQGFTNATDTWKRKDIGFWRKARNSLWHTTVATTISTGQVGAFVGRKLFKGGKNLMKDFQEMLQEKRNLDD